MRRPRPLRADFGELGMSDAKIMGVYHTSFQGWRGILVQAVHVRQRLMIRPRLHRRIKRMRRKVGLAGGGIEAHSLVHVISPFDEWCGLIRCGLGANPPALARSVIAWASSGATISCDMRANYPRRVQDTACHRLPFGPANPRCFSWGRR